MAKIKRTAADEWFSKCVREAANWTCEGCGKEYEEGSQGLHCSHYFGRRAYGIRFDPDNAFAHCYGCHQKFGANPDDFRHWFIDRRGEGIAQVLREKREDIGLAKTVKKNLKDVAAHYRAEFKRLKAERGNGQTGPISLVGYV